MNICIFGGSFNPIHNGHIALARTAHRQCGFDEVWMMLSPRNPLKTNDEMMSDELRLSMLQTALKRSRNIKASDFELKLPRPSYTINTLHSLEKSYPNHKFSLLIGADNWLSFDKWAAHKEIIANYAIIIYPRKGFDIDETRLPKSVRMLHTRLYDISSTQIRSMIQHGENIDKMVPRAIIPILQQNAKTTQ